MHGSPERFGSKSLPRVRFAPSFRRRERRDVKRKLEWISCKIIRQGFAKREKDGTASLRIFMESIRRGEGGMY